MSDQGRRRTDLAARAAWLYYIGGKTQEEIAQALNTSRQGAQRLVALAASTGLIKFRLDHRIERCAELADALQSQFGLTYCDVVPEGGGVAAVALSVAEQIESALTVQAPVIIGVGSGRMLRAAVQQVHTLERPQHKIVSLVGNVTRDGRGSPYDVVMRLSDVASAQCYPLPLPLVADDAKERAVLRAHRSYATVCGLAGQARAQFVGIGPVEWGAPLHRDGFITDAELGELIERGAVGEICGWAFGADGAMIAGATNERVCAPPLDLVRTGMRVCGAAGPAKVRPLRAALAGRLFDGLVTDEPTAEAVLAA